MDLSNVDGGVSTVAEDDKSKIALRELGFDFTSYRENYLFYKKFGSTQMHEESYTWHEKAAIIPRIIRYEDVNLYQLLENTGFNLLEFATRTLNCLFTNVLNQNTLFILWNLIFFEGASNMKQRATQILISAFIALLVRTSRVKVARSKDPNSQDKKDDENTLKNNQFYKSKNAEQVEWWIKVEGHFNFDVFGFIDDTIDIQHRYFVSNYTSKKPKTFFEQIKDTFSYFVDDKDFKIEEKLQYIVKSYNNIFSDISDRNRELIQFYKENYNINTQNWPDCISYKSYSQVLEKAFPGFSKNLKQGENSWPLCMTNYINPSNIKKAKSLWVVVENVSVVGESNSQPSLLLSDFVNLNEQGTQLIKTGKIETAANFRIIDLTKDNSWLNGTRLRFTLSNGSDQNSGQSIKDIDIGAFEGEHFYIVNMGNVAITISCFFSESVANALN